MEDKRRGKNMGILAIDAHSVMLFKVFVLLMTSLVMDTSFMRWYGLGEFKWDI